MNAKDKLLNKLTKAGYISMDEATILNNGEEFWMFDEGTSIGYNPENIINRGITYRNVDMGDGRGFQTQPYSKEN